MDAIALGIITKYADCTTGILSFLENAQKYGYSLDRLIIAYSHGFNKQGIARLSEYTQVDLLPINQAEGLYEKLEGRGISKEDYAPIILWEDLYIKCLVPYGIYRNNVLLWAILSEMDYLFFVDTDVYPELLVEEQGEMKKEEVDFFGRHLAHLKQAKILCTTSDYTGYYIIPPMNFKGIRELFEGLQKESALPMVREDGCLITTQKSQRNIRKTAKLLGGNLGIKINAYKKLSPFFSDSYEVGDHYVLTRGEDTLLGLTFQNSEDHCMDIDTKIFHNTFGHFPQKPDILKESIVRDRFYFACLGWIGRNHFLNYILGRDVRSCFQYQDDKLMSSSLPLSRYLKDSRFEVLPLANEIAYHRLPKVIETYEKTMAGFHRIINNI